jgi:hypothetical protein
MRNGKTFFTLPAACAAVFMAAAQCRADSVNTDVLVIGGGASGVAAAIESARLGAKTLVASETPWLGGMLTAAGVSAADGNNKMPSGIWGEFRDKLREHYGGARALDTGWVSHTMFEPYVGDEIFKAMLAKEKGAQAWYNSRLQSIKRNGNGWEAVFTHDGKPEIVDASIVIDATELGDVAKACGVPYDVGMDSSSSTGENIAPAQPNDIVQDMTYVAILKDYGPGADKTIQKPEGYNPSAFYCSCKSAKCAAPKEPSRIFTCDKMLSYGKLPGGEYMLNWPVEGNDYYANIIDMTQQRRDDVLKTAKNFTLGFVYYIQTELGYKNLGLAYDEFPTPDKMPFIPYYRESRRIRGLVRFTVDDIAHPFERPEPLYRTGIAVGDYPVDQHHGRYNGEEKLPDLHFYPVPSYSLPLGTLLPKGAENLIVAEKSISVSNIANGTTRLQPVVLQIGQAAGALAALAIKDGTPASKVPVREVQAELIKAKAYVMPYADVTPDNPLFKQVQRIGATGILRGDGKSSGWENTTLFRPDDPLKSEELAGLYEMYPQTKSMLKSGVLTLREAAELAGVVARSEKIEVPDDMAVAAMSALGKLGIIDFTADRPVRRAEMAALLDAFLDPFNKKQVDIRGNLIPAK